MANFQFKPVTSGAPELFAIELTEGVPDADEEKLLHSIREALVTIAKLLASPQRVENILGRLSAIARAGLVDTGHNAKAGLKELEKFQKSLRAECAADATQSAAESSYRVLEEHEGQYFLVRKIAYADGHLDIGIAARPKETIPEAHAKLYVDISGALSILRVLYRPSSKRSFAGPAQQAPSEFAEYFDRLFDIAAAGLAQEHVELATLALSALQQEIVDREAGVVKNAYIRKLGVWAASVIIVTALLYWIADQLQQDSVLHQQRQFFVLIGGCAVGTWLSFSMRRVILGFRDLAILEDDRLDPGIRVVFVIGLTIIIGLLFSTGMVVITIGDFNTKFPWGGSTALLIGLLCGVAEKGLSSTVSQRASEFVTRVSGGGDRATR
jgi:hypothetical protein